MKNNEVYYLVKTYLTRDDAHNHKIKEMSKIYKKRAFAEKWSHKSFIDNFKDSEDTTTIIEKIFWDRTGELIIEQVSWIHA